jgi:glycerophosphoryl diester phosphodiesterase
VLALAHRGLRRAGPENSLRSVVAAFSACDGAEVDVLVTADGVPVLRHDERLADGTPVRCLRLAEVRSLLGAGADDLPAVADVLVALSGRAGTLNLELKVPGAARALLAQRPLPACVAFTSFHAAEAMDAAALFPGTRSGLLASRWPPRFEPPGMACLSVRHPSLAAARAARPSAVLWTWTVNDEAAAAAAVAAGCEAAIGDDPEALRRWLGRSPAA